MLRLKSKNKGFTLIEVLTVVALVALMATGVYMGINRVREGTAETKLRADVASVNNAIRVYLASSGDLSTANSPQMVLDKLKTIASNGKELASMRGAMVDMRLGFEMAQTGDSGPFAVWDPAAKAFVIDEDATMGIKTFTLSDDNIPGTPASELRKNSLKLANHKDDKWVWQFAPGSETDAKAPVERPKENTSTVPKPGMHEPIKLGMPVYTPAPPQSDLLSYPLTVMIGPPATDQWTIVWKHSGESNFIAYTGPITVNPGDTLEAYLKSLDAEAYSDGSVKSAAYTPTPVQLQFSDNAAPGYSYGDLGGAVTAGSPAVNPVVLPHLSFVNSAAIPANYVNSTTFRAYWTFDASSPVSSATRSRGMDFSNTYPGDVLPLTVAAFGTRSSLTLNYVAESAKPEIAKTSVITSKQINIIKTPLRAPLVSVPQGYVAASTPMTLSLDTSAGVLPTGTRIFYRVDGQDPGDADGEPALAGSMPWTGAAVILAPTDEAPFLVKARAYPPEAAKNWFTTSSLSTTTYNLPPVATKPTFNPPPPVAALAQYPVLTAITHANDAAYTEIRYSLSTSPATEVTYTAPISVEPGVTVNAYVKSTDAMLYRDSPPATANYTPNNIAPLLTDTIPSSYTYVQLGGTLAAGSPAATVATPGRIQLSSSADIPAAYSSNANFRVYWTYDGTSPLTAGTRTTGTSFTGIYPGDPVPFSLTNYGSGSSVTVKYAANSTGAFPYIVDSAITTKTVPVAKLDLAPPLFTPASGGDPSSGVALSVDVSGGTMPAGARIYYRIDGQDPGNNSGEPAVAGSTLWVAGSPILVTNSKTIKARCYPPTSYKNWFNTSPAATASYTLPYYPDCFASDGTKKLYRLNPATGAVAIMTASAPFNVAAVAYDPSANIVYYTEDATSFRLARYNVAADTHTIIGSLKIPASGTWNYTPTQKITAITFFAGKLYYVQNATDDLVRVDITASAVTNQFKVADITNGVKNFATVGDLSSTSDGTLWIAGEAELATFNLNTLSGYQQKRSLMATAGTPYYPGILRNSTDALHIVRNASPIIYQLNGSGAEASSVTTTPNYNFNDMAAGENGITLPSVSSPFYAVTGGNATIYQLNPANGLHKPLTTTAAFNIGAVAFDSSKGDIYYLEDSASSTWRIAKYNVTTGIHSASLGDLKTAGTNLPSTYPGNLVFYNNALYYIHPSSSNLVKVSLNAAATAITDQANKSLGVTFGTIGDLALDDNGTLYWGSNASSVNTLYSYSLKFDSSLISVATTTKNFQSLGFLGGTLYGMGSASLTVDSINTSTAVPTQVAYAQPNVSFTDFAAGSTAPPPSVTGVYYAIGSSENKIYRLDPSDGTWAQEPNVAPFTLGAITYDSLNNLVYYVEKASSNWRIGKYNPVSGTHTILTSSLGNTASGWDVATSQPNHIVYFAGQLLFIDNGSDSLRYVEMSSSAITNIGRYASMNGGLSQGVVNAATLATDGNLYFASSTLVAKYDVVSKSGYTTIATTPSNAWQALFFANDATFFGIDSATAQFKVVSAINGTTTNGPAVVSNKVFTDIAGQNSNRTPEPGAEGELLSATGSANSLYRVNPDTGTVLAITRTAPFQPWSVAVDDSSKLVYYTGGNAAGEFRLGRYNLATGAHTELGNLRTGSGLAYIPADRAENLIYFRDGLYYVAKGTDDLVKITVAGNSIASQMKVRDLTGNATSWTSIGGLAATSLGSAYFGSVTGDFFGRFMLPDGSGYMSLGTTAPRTYQGLAIRSSDQAMYAVRPASTSGDLGLKSSTVAKTDGALTFKVNYDTTTALQDLGAGVASLSSLPSLYAVSGNTTLYKFDPANGNTIDWVTNAPFAIESVAVSSDEARVYYVEKASGSWRLGEYDVYSNAHSIRGTLSDPTLNYPAASQPSNLMFQNGRLYYIAEGTDDLIAVELSDTGAPVLKRAVKAADLNNDVALTSIGDIAMDTTGTLFISASNVFATWSFKTQSGYSINNAAPADRWTGLIAAASGTLYGVSSAQPGKLYQIDKATGAGTYTADFTPSTSFIDFAGPQPNLFLEASGQTYFVTTASPTIHRLDLANGRQYDITWQVPLYPTGIALDRPNGIIYTIGDAISGGDILLSKYELATGVNTAMGSVKAGGLAYVPTAAPNNLTFFNGNLYYLAKNTDDLVKITVSGSSIATETKVWDTGLPAYDWDALAIAPDSSAFVSTRTTNYLARINIARQSGPIVLKTTADGDYNALTFDGSGQFYGVLNHADLKGYAVNSASGATTFRWDATRDASAGIPICDMTSPNSDAIIGVGEQFATDGTASIFRVNPATGVVSPLTSGGLFNIGSLAFDAAASTVYYVENVTANWRLAKYDLTANTHTLIGNLDEPAVAGAWSYNPTSRPTGLAFFDGKLYYIHGGTDDLVRIDLTGSAISDQVQVADITNGAKSFGVIGDLTTTSAGTLWIAAENEVATFNLNTMGGYALKRTTTSAQPGAEAYYPGLQRDLWDGIYADRLAADTNIYKLDASGNETTLVATSPATNLIDYAGAENAPALPSVSGAFYAVNGTTSLFQVNPATGLNKALNRTAPFNMGALAYDATSNSLFYLEEGSSATWRVGRYDIASGTHAATTLGDLKLVGTNKPSVYPGNLVFFNQALYYIHPSSANLVRASLNLGLNAIVDQTNVSLGTTFQTVGDLTLDDTGLLYWVNTNGSTHTLYRYNLRMGSSLTSVGTATRAYPAMGFLGGVLYGTGGNGSSIDTINVSTGTGTNVATAQPNKTFTDFAAGSASPAPVTANFFAIGSAAKTIYRVDPATGQNVVLNNTASYNLGALAYDLTRNSLYYLEDTTLAGATLRVGKYDISAGTHTAVGDIKTALATYGPISVPKNLTYRSGALYLIVPGHDDLIKLTLNAAGSAISTTTRAAILTGGTLAFNDPGDLASNDAGMLYFTNNPGSGAAQLYRYDLAGSGGFGGLGTLPASNQSLGVLADQLYAASQTTLTTVDKVNPLTSTIASSVVSSPAVTFTDFAAPAADTTPAASDDMWAIIRSSPAFSADTNPHLVRFRNYKNTGGNVDRLDYGAISYQDGAAITAFTGSPSDLEGMTVDASGTLYFVRSVTTSIGGVSYERPLFSINLGSLSGTVVANFVGDLGPGIRSALSLFSLTASEVVAGLAPGSDGKLLFVLRQGTGSTIDALLAANSLVPDATGGLSITLRGLLQNGAVSAGNVKGLAVDASGQAYISDSDDLGIYKVNATNGLLTAAVHSTEATAGALALHQSDTDLVTSLSTNNITKVVAGANNDTTYFNPLNLWGYEATNAISFPGLPLTPPPATTGYFAANGTTTVYRIDPVTGSNVAVTTAPFAVQSLAYDSVANKLYYVEAAATNWRVGRFDVAAGAHSIYTSNLTSPGGTNVTPILAQPENLFISNGGLYTILPNSDDLVKIDLTVSAVDSIHKVADLAADVSQGVVTAASVDSSGMLFFASTAKVAKFNLATMSGYLGANNTAATPWAAMVSTSINALYGVRSDDPYKTFLFDQNTGNSTFAIAIQPRVSFTDISGSSGPALPTSGNAYASMSGGTILNRLDLATGKTYALTMQTKANPEAVAFDDINGIIYYTDTGDTPTRLHAYDLRTDTHTTVRDASFQTDLKQIGTNRPTGTHPHNLAYMAGALYYIATGTDDLYKISFTSPLVIADQVKVADIAGNAGIGSTAGSLAIDDAGKAYLSFEDADVLATFDMRTLGGYTVLNSTVGNSRYHGLTYEGGNLYGIPSDSAVSKKLYNVAVATGVRTLIGDINPIQQLLDVTTGTPAPPTLPAPNSNFFAITGGNKNIYRLDPTTGLNVLLNNTAAYNIGAIAYDQATGSIYYLEDSASATWNLGKYNVSTNTHSASLGNIKTIATAATSYPGNLVFYNNALYYIQPGSSNLTKVQLNAAATAVSSQSATSLGTTFTSVGDLSLDDTGMLYWVDAGASTNTLYKYNLRDSTGFATVGTTTKAYPALGTLSGMMYGSGGNAFVIDRLNSASGGASIVSTAQPNLTFTDFASGSSSSMPAPSVWAIGENGNAQLLKINGYDGSPTLVNYGDIKYTGSGGTLTAWAADSDIESFAVTADNFAYFVRNKDTNVNGVIYGRPLFRIDLNTVAVGSVSASFLGDLDQSLGAFNGSAITTSSNTEAVSGLVAGTDGALYGVYQTGTDTTVDKLFKLTGLAVDGANNFTQCTLVGNITNGTNIGTQVEDLEFATDGSLYAFDAKDGEMLTLNMSTAAVTALHSTEAGTAIKAITMSPTTSDFIAANSTDKKVKRIVSTGADTALFSYNSAPPWGTPTFSDMVGLKFPARNFNPSAAPVGGNQVYAVTGGNKDIYTLDLTTGVTLKVVDNAAAFNVSSLAYDPVQNAVFYLQDTASGYCLGSWNIASNAHTIIYNMTSGNDYNSVSKPTNLAWWGGYLWFIEPGTDDLVRITSSPIVASQQTKVRDITNNTVTFTKVGDLATDDTSMMYLSAVAAGNSVFAKFNISTMSGYTKIVESVGTADYMESLVFGPNSGSNRTLYSSRDSNRTIIRSIIPSTGVISTTSTATSPSLAFIDTSDRHLNVTPSSGTYYAVAGGTDRNIYTVDPETGTTSVLTTAPASFAGLSSIAIDQASGFLYYIEELASGFKLGRYSLDTAAHVSLGSMQAGGFAYMPASKPANLGYLRGALYYIATGTDDLVRIDVSSTAVTNQLQVADLNANTSLVSVGDLVGGSNYTAYFTASSKLYSFSLATLGTASVVSTFTQGTPDAVALRSDGGLLYGVFNPVVSPATTNSIYKISTSGVPSTNVATGSLSFRDLASPDISRPDDVSNLFYIGGDFSQSASAHRGIARLNRATGALDLTFNAGSGPNTGGEVRTILPVENGNILGAGTFQTFQGQAATGIIRLKTDGSVDQSFKPVFR